MMNSEHATSRTFKIAQIILNNFTFLPTHLILNSDDLELCNLPTCHPMLNSDDFELFYLAIPAIQVLTSDDFELFDLPIFLPCRCWTSAGALMPPLI